MSEEEKLKVYLEKLQSIASEKIQIKKTSAITALKEALHIIEGEMIGC